MNIKKNKKSKTTNHLQSLLNIGPATARRLYSIGITSAEQLKKSKPEKVYERLKKAEGGVLDKCVLYQLRGAILNAPWWVCKDFKEK
ncbi:MAG: TfoX/Sxy family DNA transformation protein [Candidatus Omnitrophota bacterium]|nr:MAG: TfoX/Sxy family DNA transformation protein [Candidatus Omnitrophota bacterium]